MQDNLLGGCEARPSLGYVANLRHEQQLDACSLAVQQQLLLVRL
jgi:hypothetical protein